MMIYVEGKGDVFFVQELTGLAKNEIINCRGKGQMQKYFKRAINPSDMKFLCDEDRKNKHILWWKELQKYSDNNFLENYSLNLYLLYSKFEFVSLVPELEKWLLEIADSENIKVADCFLSDNPKKLKKEIYNKEEKFLAFLNDVKSNQNLQKLKTLLLNSFNKIEGLTIEK